MVEDLKSFYQTGELDTEEGTTRPLPPAHVLGTKTSKTRREKLNDQLEIARKQKAWIEEKTQTAQLKEGVAPDYPLRLAALGELFKEFLEAAQLVRVRLKEPLRDPKNGKPLQDFAMKILSSDENEAEKQRETLEKHFEVASRYFSDLEMRTVETREGQTVIVVLGVDAEEFNAVVLAEKAKKLYEKRITEIEKEIKTVENEPQNQHSPLPSAQKDKPVVFH